MFINKKTNYSKNFLNYVNLKPMKNYFFVFITFSLTYVCSYSPKVNLQKVLNWQSARKSSNKKTATTIYIHLQNNLFNPVRLCTYKQTNFHFHIKNIVHTLESSNISLGALTLYTTIWLNVTFLHHHHLHEHHDHCIVISVVYLFVYMFM